MAEERYPAYRQPSRHEMIAYRRDLFANAPPTRLLAGRESAQRALGLRFWQIASGLIEDAFANIGRPVSLTSPGCAAAAEHYLRRVLDHPIEQLRSLPEAWPLPTVIAPLSPATVQKPSATPIATTSVSPAKEAEARPETARSRLFPVNVEGRAITSVFETWAAAQPSNAAKLCDEWGVAIRRFVELFDNLDVSDIDGDVVADFRDAMHRLPSRPKRDVGVLPLMEQIAHARANELKLLSNPTVAKLVSGLRVVLGYACDPLRIIRANPAATVVVHGSKSPDDARLPFDETELLQIFSEGRVVDPLSTLPDSEFWLQVLAPLTGMRIEEMCKLRPSNIQCEKGSWYFAIERDRAVRRRKAEADGEAEKTAKTKTSYRHVPLHWLLLEAEFLAFVRVQATAGRDWLFHDLSTAKYGSRSKAVSRKIMRHYRDIGITDEEKVFYSFRHTMKRECRGRPMKEEIADLLAGHAPSSIGRKYGAGAALSVLKEAVDMIDYDYLDWDAITTAAKARVRRAQARQTAT